MTSNNFSPSTERLLAGEVAVTLEINNRVYTVEIEPRITLLDLSFNRKKTPVIARAQRCV
jgi:predicted ATP-grasp superfamily ATP-dependent carboligase